MKYWIYTSKSICCCNWVWSWTMYGVASIVVIIPKGWAKKNIQHFINKFNRFDKAVCWHIVASVFANARRYSGNHWAASFVGRYMMKGSATDAILWPAIRRLQKMFKNGYDKFTSQRYGISNYIGNNWNAANNTKRCTDNTQACSNPDLQNYNHCRCTFVWFSIIVHTPVLKPKVSIEYMAKNPEGIANIMKTKLSQSAAPQSLATQ